MKIELSKGNCNYCSWNMAWPVTFFKLCCELCQKWSILCFASHTEKNPLKVKISWHCAKVQSSTWEGNHQVKFKCHLWQHKVFYWQLFIQVLTQPSF